MELNFWLRSQKEDNIRVSLLNIPLRSLDFYRFRDRSITSRYFEVIVYKARLFKVLGKHYMTRKLLTCNIYISI